MKNNILRYDHAPTADERDAAVQLRKDFARNLTALMDADPRIPPARGRARYLSGHLKVSHTTAGLWLAGERLPDAGNIMELMKLLNCRFEDLMLGPEAAPALLDESYVSIDCHGTDSLSGWTFHTLPETLRGLGLPRMVRMLRLESPEMMPVAGTGDIVIYDTRSQEVRESGVYVLRVRKRIVVRRAKVDLQGKVHLNCDNPDYDDDAIFQASDFSDTESPDQIQVLGIVVSRILINR